MVIKQTEIEIIQGLQKGDPKAFNELFDRLYAQLKFFAQGLTNDTAEAEDIVLRAFFTLWNMRDRFATYVNVKAFLYITIKNNCFSYLSRKKRIEEHTKEYKNLMPDISEDKEAERKLIEAELMELIYQKIEQLPKRCAQIFKLTLEGLQAGEIARQLNISTSTVTTQRALAIKYLKKIMTDEEFMLLCMCVGAYNYI